MGKFAKVSAILFFAFSVALVSETTFSKESAMRLCFADIPFYPFLMPDGSGQFQRLFKKASHSTSVNIKTYVAPWARCLEDLKGGRADATTGAFDSHRLEYAVYPMRNNSPDKSKALGIAKFDIYRTVGSSADWDGKKFSHVENGSIGVQYNFIYAHKLSLMGVKIDDHAKSTEQLIEMLLARRTTLAIVLDQEAKNFLKENEFKKIEKLKIPFEEEELYLIVSKTYYQENKDFIQMLWDGKLY